MAKILVTGATGTVGGELVKILREQGADVRVGVRAPDRADDLKQTGAELVAFDFEAPETFQAAFAGVERVFLLSPFVESFEDSLAAAVGAAREAGVKHAVRLSAFGAGVDAPLAIGQKHGRADQIVAGSGMGYTIVQPTFFQDNLIKFHLGTIHGQGAFYGASGAGKTAYVSSRDIAQVCAAILRDPGAHAGRTYVLTGPEALSDDEVAALISETMGKAVKYVNLGADELAGGLRQSGAPGWLIDAMVGLEGVKSAGYAADISPAVQEILGHAGETYAAFLARHKDILAG